MVREAFLSLVLCALVYTASPSVEEVSVPDRCSELEDVWPRSERAKAQPQTQPQTQNNLLRTK
jgi:hypothetical protein